MSPLREKMADLARNFITAFNTNTPEGTVAYRSPNCQYRVKPATTNHPVCNNAEYQAFPLLSVIQQR
ncbi:hypothetical protein HJFPF1_07604 [Paramyrothecium foliicola]|nr:hypothetical protein HJFPF1_07604 [Paramyrothecium foliicola]